jgi:hypothetical protein
MMAMHPAQKAAGWWKELLLFCMVAWAAMVPGPGLEPHNACP